MDLGSPLSSIASPHESEALRVLAGVREPMTGRRVASLARVGSRPSIQRALDRLVGDGLVLSQEAGAARLYRLNREHLLVPPVLAVLDARAELGRRLRESIGAWPVAPLSASLYGSVARGDAGPSSDVDLVVVSPEDLDAGREAWSDQLYQLQRDVLTWTGNHLEVFEVSADGLAAAVRGGPDGPPEPIVESWRRDAVTVAGRPLAELLRDLDPGPADGRARRGA